MAARRLPNIIITGTPGTGKTMTAQQLVEADPDLTAFNIGQLVSDQSLHDGWDDEFQCWFINEDKVIDALEDKIAQGGCVVDHHGCDFFPERWFDLVLVLTCDNTILYSRLQSRGYSDKKVQGNVQCEIMQTIVEEARDSYKEEVVKVLPSTTVEDMDSNVEKIVAWVQQFRLARAQ